MTRVELQAYCLNGVGLGATAVALCVPQLWPHVPWYLWQVILWVGIGSILVSVTTLLSLHLSGRQWTCVLFVVLVIAIATGGWYYKNLPDKIPLSLVEIYVTDNFSGMILPVREDLALDSEALRLHVRTIVTKYYDFNANTFYFAIYIPHSPYTMDICAYIANTFQRSILQQFSWVETSSRIPGDSATMSELEMVFTGRVYLYVKDDLSPEQIGQLHSIYKQNQLYMEFRGTEYLTHHLWEYERRDNSELKQFKQQPNHENL
jgi:hypothetical protein